MDRSVAGASGEFAIGEMTARTRPAEGWPGASRRAPIAGSGSGRVPSPRKWPSPMVSVTSAIGSLRSAHAPAGVRHSRGEPAPAAGGRRRHGESGPGLGWPLRAGEAP
jgi:hypothetical protein